MFVEAGRPPAQTEAVVPPRTPGTPVRRRLRAVVPPYLYVLPALAGLAVWVYWPLAQTVRLSFVTWNLLPTTSPVPVGLAN
ncbi:MAG TPA: hypothetical protein VK817_21380 [Trebonia sp.]|nr:hypothetical protein [Trebonia sp.]